TDAEVADEIQKMADYYRASPEEIRSSLAQQQGGEENIKNNLRTRKAIEALIKHAKVTDGEWVDENLAEAATETTGEESGEKDEKQKKSAKKEKAEAKKIAEAAPETEKVEADEKKAKKKSAEDKK
ncbi:MAG: hypothetical protein ACR2IA_08915, partial [Pyrinomonadaceae bacterium]